MTRRTILSLAAALAVAAAAPAAAQDHGAHQGHAAGGTQLTEDERAIAAVVETLFDGMRAGDSTLVRSVFHPEVRMVT